MPARDDSRRLLRRATVVGVAAVLAAAPAAASQAASGGAGLPAAVAGTAASLSADEQTRRYVHAVYGDLFGRAPDPVGLESWVGALLAGTPRVAVANGITYSDEYRMGLITDAYQWYLERDPDPAGLRAWLRAMGTGLTISRIEAGFIASAEYYARAGSTDAGWVRALYADVLGRGAADAEVRSWARALAQGAPRDQVAMGFLLSSEHLSTVVDGYYQHLLGRGIDPTGQVGWVRALQAGGRDEAIIGGIIASGEYWANVMAAPATSPFWAWGSNFYGELGRGVSTMVEETPGQAGPDTRWSTLVAGGTRAVGIDADGTLWSWGSNEAGQVGDGTTEDVLEPIPVGDDQLWTHVDASSASTAAVAADGTLWTWGSNTEGQLGRPAAGTDQHRPGQVGTDTDWDSVAAGLWHTVARRTDGTLWAWGNNAAGQLGVTTPPVNGVPADQPTPVRIGDDTDWVSVTATSQVTLAIKSDGTLWGWGSNASGLLASADLTASWATPRQILPGGGWVSVSATSHVVAVRADGTLWTWGANDRGQLGVPPTAVRNTWGHPGTSVPQRVGTDTDWVVGDAGTWHSAALKSDGSVWTWGENTAGQLGDGTRQDRSTPGRVPGVLGARGVSAGNSSTYAFG